MVEPLFIVYKQIGNDPTNDDILFISRTRNYFLVRESKYIWHWLNRHELVRDSMPVKPLTIGEIKEYLNSEYGHSDEAPEFVQDYGMLVNGERLRPEQRLWLVKKGYV